MLGRLFTRRHLINGQPSKLVNSDLHNLDPGPMNSDLHILDFGSESAAAIQPRSTPWVSESTGAPCKGAGILRPFRAEDVLGHVLGA